MRKLLIILIGAFLFASEGVGETDIVVRVINFLIFVAILWYLVADKVIAFFKERKEKIANKSQEVEKKLKETKEQKELLKAKLKEAKIKADEIVEDSKKEAEVIYDNIIKEAKEEVELYKKHFEEFKEIEIKKAEKEAVKEFLEDVLKDIHITSEDAVKIVLKKVA